MEKFRCPHDEKNVSAEYVRTRCVALCGCEQFLKCLEEAENCKKKSDKVVLEPFIIGKWLLKGGKKCME